MHQLPVDFTLWAQVKNSREKLWPGINFCLWIILTITVAWFISMMCLKIMVAHYRQDTGTFNRQVLAPQEGYHKGSSIYDVRRREGVPKKQTKGTKSANL